MFGEMVVQRVRAEACVYKEIISFGSVLPDAVQLTSRFKKPSVRYQYE